MPSVATSAQAPPTTEGCTNLAVIRTWSLQRRAAQLVAAPILDGQPAALAAAASEQVGGLLLLGTVPPGGQLAAYLAKLPVPAGSPAPLVMADEEGGGVQRLVPDVASLPWPRDMARTMPAAEVQALATRLGRQMKAIGVGADLAPVLDVDGGAGPSAKDPDGRRSFSADPAVAGSYGVAFMRGLEAAGVVAVVKHFPGLGGASGNTDYGPASTLPLSTLEGGGLGPFRAAISAGAKAVMVANASVPGLSALPASLSGPVMSGLLVHQLGFAGLVMTDSLSAGAVQAAGYSVASAAVAAVEGGADMVLFGSTLTPAQTRLLAPAPLAATVSGIVAQLVGAVSSGSLPQDRLDDAVQHVLAAKGADLCGQRAG